MALITPQQLAAYFQDEAERVKDEVARIQALLIERQPLSGKPKNFNGSGFSFSLAEGGDPAFIYKVAEAFRTAGWNAEISIVQDITGKHKVFTIGHDCLAAMHSWNAPCRRMLQD
jgi:hypothetical protein